MQKGLKLGVVLLFLSFGVFGFSALKTAPKNEMTSAGKATIRDIYNNNCARCHGADGKSQTTLGATYDAPDLTTRATKKKSAKTLARIIRSGGSSMPGFSKKLTAKEITQMVSFVKSL
ncbi:MAG TPA: cytochrome c [Pyrinomonadaceae bacterium]|nr:cytochrome c [Pyrinomonadaceae bacterium]